MHLCFSTLALLLAASSAALAQSGSVPSPASSPADPAPSPATERHPSASFTTYVEHNFASDLEDTSGNVAITRAFGDLRLDLPVANDSNLAIRLGTEYAWYDFKDATGFAPGFSEPWGNVLRYRADVIFNQKIDEHWRWLVGGDIQSAGETGAEWNKTLSFGGLGGANYSFSDNFQLGLGLYAHSRLEDDVAILPFVFFNYKFNEQWSIRTTGRNPASFGYGLELEYAASPDWTIFVGGSYQPREFRLDRHGASPNGVGQERRIPINLGVEWKASSQVSLVGYIGVNLDQQYELQDPGGNEIQKFDAEPSAFFGLQAEFKF